MELMQGKRYIIQRIKNIYKKNSNSWTTKRKVNQKYEQAVTFIGMESDKCVFETDEGTELLIHKDDVNIIKEL